MARKWITPLLALGVTVALQNTISSAQSTRPEACQVFISPNASITRDQLAAFLQLPENARKQDVQQALGMPRCKLAKRGEIDRHAYPLRFDPETWIIVEYSGAWMDTYTFTFHNGR
jgi:hypothetical protein